jgi:hypothetical protein
VKLQAGGRRAARKLSDRFQEAIDRAAMQAQAASADDYLETWRASAWQEREGELEKVADEVTAELESAFSEARLEMLERNDGLESSAPTGGDS